MEQELRRGAIALLGGDIADHKKPPIIQKMVDSVHHKVHYCLAKIPRQPSITSSSDPTVDPQFVFEYYNIVLQIFNENMEFSAFQRLLKAIWLSQMQVLFRGVV